MVHQQVPRQGRHPRHERPFVGIVAFQGSVDLDEDLLGEVLRVILRAGEAIANVEDAAVETLDNLFPRNRVAGYAATDQGSYHLIVVQPALLGNSWSHSTLGRIRDVRPECSSLIGKLLILPAVASVAAELRLR